MCPALYLRDVALPGLREGAAQASRPVPPLIAHALIALSREPEKFAQSFPQGRHHVQHMPSYSQMFAAAEYREAKHGHWTEAALATVVIHGDEAAVAAGLRDYMDMAGASELIAGVLSVEGDPEVDLERAMRLVAGL